MEAEKIQEAYLDDSLQYLTFVLAGEEYAIDILKVQEIRGFESTTRIPNTPEYLLGVINLRGSVVPIVDLRIRFNLEEASTGENAVIVLVKIVSQGGERVIGVVVDAVSDVYAINPEDVSDTPDLASNIVKQFVTGLATVEDKMIIMIDIDSLISSGVLDEESLIGNSLDKNSLENNSLDRSSLDKKETTQS